MTTPTPSPATDDANLYEDPNHPTRWTHRRRMAYLALSSMLVVTGVLLMPDRWVSTARLAAVSGIIDTFYFSMTTVVGAYMGLATFSAVWSKGQAPTQK